MDRRSDPFLTLAPFQVLKEVSPLWNRMWKYDAPPCKYVGISLLYLCSTAISALHQLLHCLYCFCLAAESLLRWHSYKNRNMLPGNWAILKTKTNSKTSHHTCEDHSFFVWSNKSGCPETIHNSKWLFSFFCMTNHCTTLMRILRLFWNNWWSSCLKVRGTQGL